MSRLDQSLADPRYRALDEWWGVRPSFSDILYDMTLDGNLVARYSVMHLRLSRELVATVRR